ncbi:gamma-glutamyltransferase [Nocardioides nematodiphilus]|uniref:gamma-glutamyltransferase n=1 Tax=Nocardioides nematodiphilus TaxID=2849669 RepID=UPI001CD9BDE4|nr:gamma-glutamyltransferase [Nocardioides nematodiphilus]MCA1982256.1 gamma-glutamyltransferase [Nocardioides nematodiphilus]
MSNPDGPRTGRPPFRGQNGAVATSHYLASQAGVEALQRGGSAVDAAIAANAVLCVAYPHMAGLGGDGFWLLAGGGIEGVEAIDASGPAAAAATLASYRAQAVNGAIPARGALAALTVPGAVDGWRLAHERHGKLAWASLFDAAIGLARDGVPVSRSVADWTAQDEPLLRAQPRTAAIFLPGGGVPKDGDRLVQSDLAASLEAIASGGARSFYEGEIASRICAALSAEGSPLAASDFAVYEARWVEPVSAAYRGHDVYEMPPPTQGFSALQIFAMLDGLDVASWGDGTADYYHHMAEAVKIAFADRDTWLTDPAFVDIPLERFLAREYIDERRALIDPETAAAVGSVAAGIPYPTDHELKVPEGDTCYFAAADDDGLVVSLISSIYMDYGTTVVAGDTGIIMQNRGAFFSLDENHPNVLAPGKRTFHTLAPAMLLKDGRPVLAFGSMGGEGQPQSQAAMATRIIDFGYDVQQAIEAPRWLMGRTWGVASRNLSLEGRISDEVVRELERRGHPVQPLTDWNDNMGHAQAILIDHETGFYEAGADPRGDGAALGF